MAAESGEYDGVAAGDACQARPMELVPGVSLRVERFTGRSVGRLRRLGARQGALGVELYAERRCDAGQFGKQALAGSACRRSPSETAVPKSPAIQSDSTIFSQSMSYCSRLQKQPRFTSV
jgi:hypothetical protein